MELGMAHSSLSDVLKAKKNLSSESALRVARKLEFSTTESDYFVSLVQLEATKDPDLKHDILSKLTQLNPERKAFDLSIDFFRVISDWYHFPILEMTHLDGFSFDAKSISDRLGITSMEVDAAIERMLRLELLEKNEITGKLQKSKSYIMIRPKESEPSLRKFNEQMLKKALKALEEQSSSERLTGTETFPLARELLPEASEIMETFFKSMTALSGSPLPKTDVYHLNVQMFNLTPERKTKP